MSLNKIALTFAAAMLLAGTAVRASEIDFTCSLSSTDLCTGVVSESGANYSTTGISVFNDSGPYDPSVPFMLSFNTATGAVSIDGTGVDLGQNLVGDILSFNVANSGSSTALDFNAVWPTLPPLVQAQLGTPTGTDFGFVLTIHKVKPGAPAKAASVDVLIEPVPEPASMVLLGSGLLAFAGILRRKLRARA